MQLRRALLALAADAMSGPGGLAAYLRRAVILRDKHCAWPGGCDKPPAGCDVHHLVFRSRGGKTRLKDLLLCAFHHDVCVHRLGWTLTLHPDGTTEARSPDGTQTLRSHGPPPTTRAG